MLTRYYESRCGNCHALMDRRHRYCHVCGTRKGGGEFKPYEPYEPNDYDPEYITIYDCPTCGKKWLIDTLMPDEIHSNFCPYCGEPIDPEEGRTAVFP